MLVVVEGASDVYGKGQTDVAVNLLLRAKRRGVHRAKVGDQTVVTCDLGVGLVDILTERTYRLPEVAILLRSLMAGVGQVKHVAVLLRIEHDRILLTALHVADQVGHNLLLSFLLRTRLPLQLVVVVGELDAEHFECSPNVTFLENRMGGQNEKQGEKYGDNKRLFHDPIILLKKVILLLQSY